MRALAAFFVDKLGFTCDPENGIFDGVDGVGRRGVRHRRARRCAVPPADPTPRRVASGEREDIEGDAYVFVDDAYALFDEYTARGVPMHRPVSRAPTYDMADFVVETPEGHRICFGSPV